MEQDATTQGLCDVKVFFNTITNIDICKYTILETNQVFFLIKSYPDVKSVWISQKDFVTSKLRNILDQHQMYLKPSIASKNRSQKIASLYQLLSDTAHQNLMVVSKKSGFYQINSPNFMFASSENSFFVQDAYLGYNIDQIDHLYSSMLKNNYSFQIHSVEAAFLITIRCFSLLMSLNTRGYHFYFPYLLVLNCGEMNSIDFTILNSYLHVYNKPNIDFSDINMAHKSMQNKILEYNNNILLLNGMTDVSSIRNENLNLLRDYYLNQINSHLCAIISNTVQAKLNCSEYLELHLENISFLNTMLLFESFSQFDNKFICTICSYSVENMNRNLNLSYQNHLKNAVQKFESLKAQTTYANIMAVKDCFVSQFFSKSKEFFSNIF